MKKSGIIFLIICVILILTVTGVLADSPYSDVGPGDWFYENVTDMSNFGYLKGYPDGSFRPDDSITAAEFVTVAARTKELSPAAAQNSHWASGLLVAALGCGWYDWDELPPTAENYDKPICREFAVKVVMRAFLPEAKGDYSVESAKISDFSKLDGRYYSDVIAAYSAGVARGNENGCFNPKSPLTRAEACALITRASGRTEGAAAEPMKPSAGDEKYSTGGGVSENGRLSVRGTQLVNEKGETVVLRGMSSHGIQWFPQFLSRECIKSTADSGANLFRIAMYTEENGYIENKGLKQVVENAVDTVTGLDMYVIIDWHILSDGNPNLHISEAKEFFAEMADRYRDNPAVIYEICNEPNGNISWSGDVKPYAEELISTIRKTDKDAVILVGTPTWSQEVDKAADDPISAENIMYTCHFYTGTHTEWLRSRVQKALEKGLPVFVSEWGTTEASGSGGVYAEETEKWLSFMDENGISWANWSLCDKNETSAVVRNGADISDGISKDELTESGRLVWEHFK